MMKSAIFHRQVAILLFLLIHFLCYGQGINTCETETIEIGKKYKFHSEVLDEVREIWVYLPKGYESGTGNYPVIYVLDGHLAFIYTAGLLRQLRSKSVPNSILIGLVGTDRRRDYTPPSEVQSEINDYPTSGGADNFIKMLEEDLFPFVNNHFRTTEFKTIIGGSLGGLFVIYALATKPDLFNAYLSFSPSLWWNNQKVVDYFEKSLIAKPDMKALLYMTMGAEGTAIGEMKRFGVGMMGGLMKLVGILESESPMNIRWGYKIHPDESHNSCGIISTIEGFEFIYKDWFVLYPEREYLEYGIKSFEMRSQRIKKEFDEDWDLSNQEYYSIMLILYELEMLSECRDLGLSLLQKDKFFFALYQTLGNAFSGLGDNENANKYYQEAYKSSPGNPEINKIIDSLGIDKRSLVPPYKLSTEEFEKLEGKYINNWNGNEISISFSMDTILYFSPDGKFQLIPTSKNKAYFINSSTTVEFCFDGDKVSPASYYILRLRDGEELKCSRKD